MKRALLLAHGDASTFVMRPISAAMLLLAFLLLLTVVLPSIRSKRKEVFADSKS